MVARLLAPKAPYEASRHKVRHRAHCARRIQGARTSSYRRKNEAVSRSIADRAPAA